MPSDAWRGRRSPDPLPLVLFTQVPSLYVYRSRCSWPATFYKHTAHDKQLVVHVFPILQTSRLSDLFQRLDKITHLEIIPLRIDHDAALGTLFDLGCLPLSLLEALDISWVN